MTQLMTESIRSYWNEHIHDITIVQHPIGSRGFFEDLQEYHFDKLRYLPEVIDISAYRGRKLLDVGCGVGTDLVRFAGEGACVTGIDLSERTIHLARRNFELHGLEADLKVMDGEDLQFAANTFDVVYAHGVLPYTMNVERMIDEIHRVLKPGGEAILQVYNRHSWLYLLSKTMKVALEHENAPVFHTHSLKETRRLLKPFKKSQIVLERFPVKTRLHTGVRGVLYNTLFVTSFNAIPRPLVRRFGWHIIATATK